ncbi:hypothetical protein [Homoserinimonas aerilata]|uniref:YobI family P-loop NTPase n=1 Tax=Homoserinimonas aerilata TaxID=1162970 RepID=UPI001153710F|nr:hypothetical protein [Homoserinimonas aerilata]
MERKLLSLVGRHTTDMRLMTNICNEFVVYAEKLLWSANPVPGMTPDDLFAIVVYKNFHVTDFEALPQRESALDTLERRRRDFVQESIKALQAKRESISRGEALKREQADLAAKLGSRLDTFLNATGSTLVSATVGAKVLDKTMTQRPAFWSTIATEGELTLDFKHPGGYRTNVALDRTQLAKLFPDGINPESWGDYDTETASAKRRESDAKIASLRGADFTTLAHQPHYTVNSLTFSDHINATLSSELARDLVRQGFLNRYYAEYSSVFYGKFLGVDVAHFFRNSVWPNEMDIHFKFATEGAIKNLLEQAPDGFTSSRSALNLEVVDYLLQHRRDLAMQVVRYLVTEAGEERDTFLEAFLGEKGLQRKALVALLAEHPWRGLYEYLAKHPDRGLFRDPNPGESDTDADVVGSLLNAALLSGKNAAKYDWSSAVQSLVVDLHSRLPAFTKKQQSAKMKDLYSFIVRAEMIVPSLKVLSEGLRERVTEERRYALTADNLRAAIGLGAETPVTLERIRQREVVWDHCASAPDTFLRVVAEDKHTPHVVADPEVLRGVVDDVHDRWSQAQLDTLLRWSSPKAALPDLTLLPKMAWQSIAKARRMVPSVENLHAYTAVFRVDDSLAGVLITEDGHAAEIIDVKSKAGTRDALTIAILNASEQLTPTQRVWLVLKLVDGYTEEQLDVSAITSTGDNLLAKLLEAELVADTFETFKHFATAGWEAIAAAFRISAEAHNFINSELVGGHAADLLEDPLVPSVLQKVLIVRLEDFAEANGVAFLRAAAAKARTWHIRLTMAQLELISKHASDPEDVVWQLARTDDGFDGPAAMHILSLLGGDYEGFSQSANHEFEIAKTDSTNEVLKLLRDADLVSTPPGGRGTRRMVKLC